MLTSAHLQGLRLNERLVYVRPDGTQYNLHAPPSSVVMQTEGFGTPPIDYVVDRAPFQHGDTVRSYALGPRPVQLVVMQNFCSRADYWSGRSRLLDSIRPNRVSDFQSPGKLLYLLPNGLKRQIDVMLDEGPGFVPAQQGWRAWSFTEVLRFTAHDPAWYDPSQQSVVFDAQQTADDELVFPITFPITFESFGGTELITYAGTWLDYPTIIITGPATGFTIRNVTTDKEIGLNYSLTSGNTITIRLRRNISITLQDGTNLLNYVTADSDLTEFALVPDPEAPGGVNEIAVSADSISDDTTVTVQWYNRYIGI